MERLVDGKREDRVGHHQSIGCDVIEHVTCGIGGVVWGQQTVFVKFKQREILVIRLFVPGFVKHFHNGNNVFDFLSRIPADIGSSPGNTTGAQYLILGSCQTLKLPPEL